MGLITDLVYAARTLRRSPLFTLAAVLSLALGIGANAALLSIFDQIWLRSLPVRDPGALVILRSPGDRPGSHFSDDSLGSAWSYPMYREFRDRNQVFSGLLARFVWGFSLAHEGMADRVTGELVSGNYFEVLGVQPAMGRLFTREDDLTPGGHPVVALSHLYWKKRFGLDPKILNQTVHVGGYPMTVVGVAQEGFSGVQRGVLPDVWIPMAMKTAVWQGATPLDRSDDHWLHIFGRLKPGVTAAQAQTALAPLFRALKEPLADKLPRPRRQRYVDSPLILEPGAQGRRNLQDEGRQPLKLAIGIAALVLLIACANVAGLLLARGAMRRKEVAVRLAIGASRWRLVKQLFAESLLVAAAAGALSMLVSYATIRGIFVMLGDAPDVEPRLDARLLALHFGIALGTALVFGLIPAFDATRAELTAALKDMAGGGAKARFRKALVTGQVLLTFVLLVVSGLLVESLRNLHTAGTGMRHEQVVRFQVAPGMSGYDAARTRDYVERLHRALGATPGVLAVSMATVPVFSNSNSGSSYTFEGYQAGEDEDVHLFHNFLGPGYFATLGVPLVSGREFDARDEANGAKVCLINESTARRFFKDRNPIGRKLVSGTGRVQPDTEIVGVVKDSKHSGMRETPRRYVYFPVAQQGRLNSATFYVRTASPEAMFAAVREEARRLDAAVPVSGLSTLDAHIARSLENERILALLAASFAVLAAALAGVGLYGVMAFVVARRSREIGIRMALGAGAANVRGLVVKEVLAIAATAIAAGIPAAWGAGRVVRSMLYGVGSVDPAAMTAAVLGVTALAAIAGYVPARRATRIDPMTTLRQD